MDNPSHSGPRIPGAFGSATDPKGESASGFLRWPSANSPTAVCAKIYFVTNRSELGSDDLGAIEMVVSALKYLIQVGDGFDCTCEGHADCRGESRENMTLSARRAEAVANEIRLQLPEAYRSCVRSRSLGESRASSLPSGWAEDRRVDVRITVHPLRLRNASLGFETDEQDGIKMSFLKTLERMELDSGGKLLVWLESECGTLRREVLDSSRYARGGGAPDVQYLARMTHSEYVAEVRSRATACVRIDYRYVPERQVHRLSGQILDAATLAPIFPEESVEAETLLDENGTYYLSSPEGSPTQVWRMVASSSEVPAGRPSRTVRGKPTGITAKPRDLFDRLRGPYPNVTGRVQGWLEGR